MGNKLLVTQSYIERLLERIEKMMNKKISDAIDTQNTNITKSIDDVIDTISSIITD